MATKNLINSALSGDSGTGSFVGTNNGDLTSCINYPASSLTSGGIVLISSQTASASADLTFSSLTLTGYAQVLIVVSDMLLATAGSDFAMVISTGAGFLGGTNYKYQQWRYTSSASGVGGSTGGSAIPLSDAADPPGATASQNEINGSIVFNNPFSSVAIKGFDGKFSYYTNSAVYLTTTHGGQVTTNSAPIDGFRFLASAGNLTSGKVTIYGIKNA